MAEALEWSRDFLMFAAQHAEEFQRLRERLEREDAAELSARTRISPSAATTPANGSVVSILDHVRRDR